MASFDDIHVMTMKYECDHDMSLEYGYIYTFKLIGGLNHSTFIFLLVFFLGAVLLVLQLFSKTTVFESRLVCVFCIKERSFDT